MHAQLLFNGHFFSPMKMYGTRTQEYIHEALQQSLKSVPWDSTIQTHEVLKCCQVPQDLKRYKHAVIESISVFQGERGGSKVL